MSDVDSTNLQAWIDPELEARVVAWILGEASAFERAELERRVSENAELAIFKRRIEAVHGLLGLAEGSPVVPIQKWQLSAERRAKVLNAIGAAPAADVKGVIVAANPRKSPKMRVWLIAAALLMVSLLVLGITFRALRGSIHAARKVSAHDHERIAAMEREVIAQPALPQNESDSGIHQLNKNAIDSLLADAPGGRVDTTEAAQEYFASAETPASSTKPTPGLSTDQVAKEKSLTGAKGSGAGYGGGSGSGEFAMNAQLSVNAPAQLAMPAPAMTPAMPTSAPEPPRMLAAQSQMARAVDLEMETSAVGAEARRAAIALDGSERERANVSPNEDARQSTDFAEADTRVVGGVGSDVGGFINYGSPVPSTPDSQSHLADNVINQPIFSSRSGEVKFEGFVNYGSPISSVIKPQSSAAPAPQREARAVLRDEAAKQDMVAQAQESAEPVLQKMEQEMQALPQQMAKLQEEQAAVATASDRMEVQEQVQEAQLSMAQERLQEAGAAQVAEATTASASVNQALAKLEVVDELIGTDRDQDDLALGERNVADKLVENKTTIVSESMDAAKDGLSVEQDAKERESSDASVALLSMKTDGKKLMDRDVPILGDVPLLGHAFKRKAATPKVPARETGEVSAEKEPFSTFSFHVSDVSFRLAQAALAKGELPDPGTVRAEEFYNAFDYGDPAPRTDEPVNCKIEQSAHPFLQQRNLVRIAMRVPATGRGSGQPLRLTILLDTSGSMEREDRALIVPRAIAALASLLGPNDRVTVIGFARVPRLIADQMPGTEASKLVDLVRKTPSEGGTNMEQAITLAGEKALQSRVDNAQNRIVLITDGAANLGNADPVKLGGMIEELRQKGIAFDACGVGADGLDDEILESLARRGDGRYYLLNSPGDVDAGFAEKLAGAFRPAAKNVKAQIQFNPSRVSRYRLIGFEKHRLNKEDFRNDKVDAAELAAEEAAVAVYQIEVQPDGDGELGEVFVRFQNTTTGDMVERSWTMGYETQPRAFDQSTPSMKLAGSSALLAEKLIGGPAGDSTDLELLKPIVSSLRGAYPHEEHVRQFLTMFDQVAARLK
jgi:secreted protein with Ig-like and vWFA domain